MDLAQLSLRVLAHGAGSVEWRVEAPALAPRALGRALLLGLAVVAAPAACLGAGCWGALLLAVAAALALLAAHALLGVQSESLTYIRLLGVRLATRRRCGLWSSSRFLPLRQLQGIIIHEEVTATSVHFWLGLTLKEGAQHVAAGGSSSRGSSAGASAAERRHSSDGGGFSGRRLVAECGEAEVVFPRLRPRLSLLRQVYQQLQPLLLTDIAAIDGAEDGEEEEEVEGLDEKEGAGVMAVEAGAAGAAR